MKNAQNQKGAMVVEIALVVITLAALGFAIYTVNQARSDAAKKPINQTSNPVTRVAPLDDSAAKYVQEFYQKYIDVTNARDNSNQLEMQKSLVRQYGDPVLLASYGNAPGYDPVLCAQNTVESFSIVSHARLSPTEATVNLSRKDYPGEIIFLVKGDSRSYKIDKITCPAT